MATSLFRNASPSVKQGKAAKEEKPGKDKEKDAAKKVCMLYFNTRIHN